MNERINVRDVYPQSFFFHSFLMKGRSMCGGCGTRDLENDGFCFVLFVFSKF